MISANSLRVVLIGPLPNLQDALGGAAVTFQILAEAFANDPRVAATTINTSRPRQSANRWQRSFAAARSLVASLWQLVRAVGRHDVVLFNASPGGLFLAGPMFWLVCRVYKTKFVVRVFGGNLDVRLRQVGRLRASIIRRSVLNADLVLLETRRLVRAFETTARVDWYPNTRDLAPPVRRERSQCRKLVFISQLRPEKGILELLQACRDLPAGAVLDVYGPWMDGIDRNLFDDFPAVRYRGVIPHGEVPTVLGQSDVLVLPTKHVNEGYSGVVIEALQCEVPVVATRHGGLPEVVEHGVSGCLVPPGDVDALRESLHRLILDDDYYQRLAEGCRASGERFRSPAWTRTLLEHLRQTVEAT